MAYKITITIDNDLEQKIMAGIDDLKREIAETGVAIDTVAAAVADVVTRVQSIGDQLKNFPSDAVLTVLASELDDEQQKLNIITAALAEVGKVDTGETV